MKINKTRSKKPIIITAVAVLTVLLVGYVALAKTQNIWPFTKENDTSVKTSKDIDREEKETKEARDAQQKQDFLDNENSGTKNNTDTTSDTSVKPKPSKKPVSNSQIDLAAESQDQSLVVTTKLKNITSGTCELTLTKGSKTVKESANIIYTPEYSTCEGFAIDKSRLGSGVWNIRLVVKTASASPEKTITYKLQGTHNDK